jgi:hypothetical protein
MEPGDFVYVLGLVIGIGIGIGHGIWVFVFALGVVHADALKCIMI